MPEAPKLSRRLFFGGALAGAGAAGAAAGALAAGALRPGPDIVKVPGEQRRFVGRSVMITGATSGIGRAAALAFAAEGARVSFCGRREHLGTGLQAEIAAAGGDAVYIRADVRDPESVTNFIDRSLEHFGPPDIAFNNAGISASQPFHETRLEDWNDIQDTNVRGVFLCMQAQIPLMRENGGGTILVTSSANAEGARPGLVAYNASKRALVGLVQTAALEYAADNIRINALCPGATDTPMIRRQSGMENAPDAVWQAGVGVWAQSNVHALKRIASAEEMARAALSLCAPEMTYLTGSAVFVDGGMTAAL
ncbi:SDR family NAD(P)-dependent oxidoreductase [Pelagibacterium sp.]|uniref:SDR family NAD(P)-dependent oxidoreductase n=1 Tax=Pelagibacterium sp. TaxID=1967288 RepID=UPI003BAC5BF3